MNDFENVSTDISGYVTMIMHTGKYNFDTDEIEDGEQVARRDLKNLIVNRSSALLSAAVLPKNNIAITHLAVGVGNEDGLMPIEDIRYNKLIKEVEDLSLKTFRALNLSGVARIDFLIDKETKEVYVNEPNTIPGSLSFYLLFLHKTLYEEFL